MKVKPFTKAVLVLLGLGTLTLMAQPLNIGDRRELMVDRYLVDELQSTRLKLNHPRAEEIVLRLEEPWERWGSGYAVVLQDGDDYKLYYRGIAALTERGRAEAEYVCYAESRDGIHWTKPVLGMHEFRGSKLNNIILSPPEDGTGITHNFAPFLDNRAGVPADERYKAVAGLKRQGLFRFVSPDGINWRRYSDEPLFAGYALDSLNVAAWLPAEQVYAIYLRTWTEGGTPDRPEFKGNRTVSRSVSPDFKTWSKPEPMTFGDTASENLYTQGTHPYFRAPHILIAMPFRLWPERRVQSEAEQNAFDVLPSQRKGISDVVFMISRGGNTYDRTFMESFIRPGLDRKAWHARNMKPAKGVVQTGDAEMSLYVASHNTLRSGHLRRYSLPLDRFASVNAPHAGGTFLSKPLIFSGDRLTINYSTSAAGSIRVEIRDEAGRALPGYTAADADEIIGDEIARTVTWKGKSNVQLLSGRPIRLKFHMADADLYAIKFGSGP